MRDAEEPRVNTTIEIHFNETPIVKAYWDQERQEDLKEFAEGIIGRMK
jgi:hypothetical protein